MTNRMRRGIARTETSDRPVDATCARSPGRCALTDRLPVQRRHAPLPTSSRAVATPPAEMSPPPHDDPFALHLSSYATASDPGRHHDDETTIAIEARPMTTDRSNWPERGTAASSPTASDVPTWQRHEPVAIDPVQYKAWCDEKLAAMAGDPSGIQQAAAEGVSGSSATLPHGDAIQAAFGHHDVSRIQAHVGGAATDASAQMGAQAYATGNRVAFASQPDLRLAAHEAAHVVQQRGGVQLKGGVGESGDAYEQHADQVADAVVRGESAAPLLDQSVAACGISSSATAVQRKGASEEQLAGAATNTRALSPEVLVLNTALRQIELAEADAQNLLEQFTSGARTHEDAYGALVRIMQSMLGPLGHFDNAQRAVATDRPGGEISRDLFGHDQAPNGQQDALDRWRPRVLDSLNNVARVAHLLNAQHREAASARDQRDGGDQTRAMRRGFWMIPPDPTHHWVALEASVTALASVGAGLGWSPPATLAEADTRRYDLEACPTGAREERPDHCNLPDIEREARRRKVTREVERVIGRFIEACVSHKAPLEAMVAKIAAGRELLVDIVTDAVRTGLSAVTAGTGGKAVDLALGVSRTLAKAEFNRPGTRDAIPQADSVNMLESLKTALIAQVEAIDEQTYGLDDAELLEVHGALESLTKDFFKAKLTPFVAAYREQIEPIGHVGPLHHDRMNGAMHRSVWAVAGERRRLALVVDHAYQPDLWMAPRDRTPRHEYRFERWIDAQFEPIVDGDTIDVPAEKIDGLPFAWVAGVAQ